MNIASFTSTTAVSDESQLSIRRLQLKLIEAQKELGSGRHADVGMTLGAGVGRVISLRQDIDAAQSLIDANSVVETRLKASQIGLQTVSDLGQEFLATLVSAKTANGVSHVMELKAQSGLKALIEAVNMTVDGQYIFSGVNTDIKPLDDFYSATPSSSKQSFDAAFLAKFGITQQDPAVAAINPTDMAAFVANEAAAEFADPAWGANWSAASDKNVKNRISRMDVVETSVNVNDDAFRKLVSALTMVAETGFDTLNEGARNAVLDKAIAHLGEGVAGVARLQSGIGIVEERVSTSNEVLTLQKNLLTSSVDELEGVDTTELSTRIANLMTQMETAYAITSRLNNLSLLNYISK